MRSNYKAKWQAALQEQRPSTSTAAKEHVQNIDENRRINTDLNLAVQQIASINGQVTAAAADVLEILDETRNLAGLNFGEVQMEIDSKASKLPIHISLRRTRDILKMITARYAALAVIVEDQEEAIRTYAEKVKTIPSASHLGTRTLLDNVWIGPYSTEVEREDYKESRDEYKRYNLTYEDLDDDWLTTHITGGSALRERKPSTPSLVNGDSSDSELDEAQQRTMTVVKNRRAVVTPISPVQKKLKSHDDLA